MDDLSQFRALSFDCYGTLIDWETGLAAELVPWADGHGITTDRDDLLAAYAGIEAAVQGEHPAMAYPDILGEVLARIAERYGVEASMDERTTFAASVGRWPAFADTAAALRRLQERFRLIILSNVDRASLAASNERLGVEFDLIITAEDVGAYKPSAASFAALIAGVGALGVEPPELLHVAQSRYHDHEPARAVGLETAWIDRRHDRPGGGATPAPNDEVAVPTRRFPSLEAFADAAIPTRR